MFMEKIGADQTMTPERRQTAIKDFFAGRKKEREEFRVRKKQEHQEFKDSMKQAAGLGGAMPLTATTSADDDSADD